MISLSFSNTALIMNYAVVIIEILFNTCYPTCVIILVHSSNKIQFFNSFYSALLLLLLIFYFTCTFAHFLSVFSSFLLEVIKK